MKPIRRVSAKKYRGLGDVVATVAQPIARTIDRIAGTDIQNCPGCKQRRETLNRKIPFKTASD
jgi:hypothetical protein